MRDYSAIIDRRFVCYSAAGLAVNAVLGDLPFGIKKKTKMASAEQAFLIVNGWVLTREDLVTNDLKSDVV